eukprot:1143957-Pelagomonas_calceolata.AAC.1
MNVSVLRRNLRRIKVTGHCPDRNPSNVCRVPTQAQQWKRNSSSLARTPIDKQAGKEQHTFNSDRACHITSCQAGMTTEWSLQQKPQRTWKAAHWQKNIRQGMFVWCKVTVVARARIVAATSAAERKMVRERLANKCQLEKETTLCKQLSRDSRHPTRPQSPLGPTPMPSPTQGSGLGRTLDSPIHFPIPHRGTPWNLHCLSLLVDLESHVLVFACCSSSLPLALFCPVAAAAAAAGAAGAGAGIAVRGGKWDGAGSAVPPAAVAPAATVCVGGEAGKANICAAGLAAAAAADGGKGKRQHGSVHPPSTQYRTHFAPMIIEKWALPLFIKAGFQPATNSRAACSDIQRACCQICNYPGG